jgi:threonine/homoserine/homoserine lactone efflux protein
MTALVGGLALGLGAGVAPGPLLTLVVTSTLQRGFGAGLRVAVAPLLTDTPIVAAAVLVVGSVSEWVLRALGLAGGSVVVLLGLWTAVSAARPLATDGPPVSGARDVARGVLVNVLSPHPWIFWFTAGAPLLVSAWREAPWRGVAFLIGFYLLLVGAKVVIAWLVARGARRLSERSRRMLLVAGGVALVVGGALLLWQAGSGRL